MTCCTRLSTKHLGACVYKDAAKKKLALTGTWDFKWPRGTKVRVAFQKPAKGSPEDFNAAKKEIRALAETWTVSAGKPVANIALEWLPDDLEQAKAHDPEGRSTFKYPGTDAENKARNYDVLVSLDQLPPKNVGAVAREGFLALPRAELGSFARRRDYGVPTLHIGPIEARARTTLAEYYQGDNVARFYVVHEFGHALGLPHGHQDPVWRKSWNNPELQALVCDVTAKANQQLSAKRKLGEVQAPAYAQLVPIVERLESYHRQLKLPDMTPEQLQQFALTQLLAEWGGNPQFSDWPVTRLFEQDSVMDGPYFRCLLGLHGSPKNLQDEKCDECEARYVDKPYSTDHDWLRQLYPL